MTRMRQRISQRLKEAQVLIFFCFVCVYILYLYLYLYLILIVTNLNNCLEYCCYAYNFSRMRHD
jgi:hypothetical protein